MALPYPAELVNTLEFIADACNRRRAGLLETATSVRAVCAEWRFPGASTVTKADLGATWAHLRTIETMWDAERDQIAEMANRLFRRCEARPHLVRHDGFDWHLHGLQAGAPIADAIAVNAAMALADLVRVDDTVRLKRCGDDRCERMFLDLSRNRSRRFCSTTCQSRTNVAAFRARHGASLAE